ncbi:PTS mannose transporter subunit IID [uncultured Mitsuokella sp.]|uniref:PTS mannose transporter subunit IID n=1 Tax=uncultured Mitsuokella sp. TaxID=453120 RepID=UPI00258758AE|nr:PTS mannose transporter subunit IID [uncultured Mitsuokella sp.]
MTSTTPISCKVKEENTTMEKKLNKKDLINIFIRSNFLLGSFNFERMQAIGFCVSLLPALRKVYKDDKPAMAAAMKRHLEFFNTQPFLATPIMGITAAMEEKKANGADISDQTISGVKVGLMGPLAGVGDPIFWGTLRPVLAALGAGIALTGSIMGPLIFFLVFNAIRLATNWYGVMYGYSKGTELVDEMGGNKMRFLTEGSSVLGLLVMGALVAKWTTVNMPLVLSSYTNSAGEQVTTTVQTILDSLMPGIVPLLMTFACMWLLRKNVNPLIIILGLFALGIVGYAIGLFA